MSKHSWFSDFKHDDEMPAINSKDDLAISEIEMELSRLSRANDRVSVPFVIMSTLGYKILAIAICIMVFISIISLSTLTPSAATVGIPMAVFLSGILGSILVSLIDDFKIDDRNKLYAAAKKPPITFAELIAMDGCVISDEFPEYNVIQINNGFYRLTPQCARILCNKKDISSRYFLEYFKNINKFKDVMKPEEKNS